MRFFSMLALLGCTSEPEPPMAAGDRNLTVVYTNNLDGEIEPCG
ncbi:MAG: hypothetical protein P8R54_13060 [Myxococcota bacterium]|nr:hypothetical protein [Myxococcota bacterium]